MQGKKKESRSFPIMKYLRESRILAAFLCKNLNRFPPSGMDFQAREPIFQLKYNARVNVHIINVFLCYLGGHQISISGHQKLIFKDFSGPTGPLRKNVSVEPWLNIEN